MGLYPIRILVHGAPVDTHLACPFDGITNLRFPVYLNDTKSNTNRLFPSGLVQPLGPIKDDNSVALSGIARPNWPGQITKAPFFRPAPSGLERDYRYAWDFQGGFGHDGQRHFEEVNWYQAYWVCASGHFFIYPSGVLGDMPGGFQAGMTTINPPASWGNFE